jgi:hypothetical protein
MALASRRSLVAAITGRDWLMIMVALLLQCRKRARSGGRRCRRRRCGRAPRRSREPLRAGWRSPAGCDVPVAGVHFQPGSGALGDADLQSARGGPEHDRAAGHLADADAAVGRLRVNTRTCPVDEMAPLGPSSENVAPAPTSRSMPSRTILPPNDLRSPVAVIALVMLLLPPSPRPGGRDHVEGARSGIHRGFTAVSFAGPGARRSGPAEERLHPGGPHLRSRQDRYQESKLTPGPAPRRKEAKKPPVARHTREPASG